MTRSILPKTIVLLGLLLALLPPLPSPAQDRPAPEPGQDDAIRERRRAIREATGAREKADGHKRLGDLFANRTEFPQASEEYLAALTLSREFPEEELFRMARVLSWAGRLDEAIAELGRILDGNPGNVAARIHLARCLSWKGRLRRAEREINGVLAAHPGNREAMLVKANLLRWRGDLRRALSLNRGALGGEEDFGARTGLAYTFLSAGDIRRARAERERLKAEFPYQEKEIAELDRALRGAAGPSAQAGYAYYHDSDGNRADRYQGSLSAWARTVRLGLALRYVDARDDVRHADAREISLNAYSRVTESLGLGASAGILESRAGDTDAFGTGSARVDLLVPGGSASASAAREILTDTAPLIDNSVRVSAYRISVSRYLGGGATADAAFALREYSDDNRSNDLILSARVAADIGNPRISAGYRFRYLDFRRETGSGYFDPSDFLAHQVFVTFHYGKGKAYTYLEPYSGRQSFKRNGAENDDWFGGGSGVVGIKLGRKLTVEIHGEGGNYAVGTAAGFSYYLAGLRVNAAF